MTFLLVAATVVALATAHWYFRRARELTAARAREAVPHDEPGPSAAPADDVRFHPGQTWVQVHDDRLVSVGATGFAANFAGELEAVRVPAEGKRCRRADPGLTLVSKSGRELELALPVEGRVLAVNPAVLRDPGLIQRRPYDLGWILRVRPRRLSAALADLLPRRIAEAWGDAVRTAVTARLAGASGVPAFDGGEWAIAFGERLQEEDWKDVQRSVFPSSDR